MKSAVWMCRWTGVAASAALASGQGDRPPLRLLEAGIRVEPVRVAPAALEGGEVVRIGAWVELGEGGPRGSHDTCRDYRVFDCYGDHDFDGYPDDWSDCNMGAQRWHFGSGYCNGFYSNDMVLGDDALVDEGAWRADVAWYWTCAGEESEQCVMAIFTQNSDPNLCENDTFDYPGWLIDFDELPCNPGAYYFAWVDISPIGRWELPPSGRGSYATMYLTDDGTRPAGCAQTMLWSSPNNWGGDPDGPGAQGPGQLDDDNPPDGHHQAPTECYTYSFGICNDPLGAMLQFWGERVDPPGNRADFNGDGAADTRDVVAFLSAWARCGAGADCDHDRRCSTKDLICFLDLWVECGG